MKLSKTIIKNGDNYSPDKFKRMNIRLKGQII